MHRAPDGTDEVGVDGGLDALGLLRVYGVGTDASLMAGLNECLLVTQVIFRQRDEQTVGRVYTVTGDTPEDGVLLDTL